MQLYSGTYHIVVTVCHSVCVCVCPAGILLLAKWLDRDPKELPKDAETIIEYCRGSPMVIALIGAILKKNPTSDRKWKLIVEKLKKKHFHSIKLHASVNEWSYQHATLNASIELSVESLPEHLQVYTVQFYLSSSCVLFVRKILHFFGILLNPFRKSGSLCLI